MGETPERERRGMLTAGIIVTGVGVVFLLERLDIIPHIGDMWPLFPIIVGVALILGGLRRDGRRGRRVYGGHERGVQAPAPPGPEPPPRDETVRSTTLEEELDTRDGPRRDSERHDPARRGPGNA